MSTDEHVQALERRWSGADRARANVRSLMDAALGLWEAEGSDVVCVDDICANAGLAKGTFYSYFRRKEVLVIALTFSRMMPDRRRIKELLDSDRSTLSVLDEVLDSMAAGARTLPKPLVREGIENGLCQQDNTAKLYSTDYHYRICIRQIIARGVSRGEIRKCWSVSAISGSLAWSLLQAIQIWAGGLTPDALLESDFRERAEILIQGAATIRIR
jgi:TetR/AcrR family transcriptional regulator, cholesterol catabolism regulator